MNDFDPNKIFEIFENVREAKDSEPEKIHFYIQNESGSDVAEVFYITAEKYWATIKDNFPMQRKRYSWDLPTKSFDQMIRYFSYIDITLVKK